MATLQLAMPPKSDFRQDDLPSPGTHHMTCFGCAFSRTSLQYQVLEDEECSNNGRSSSDKDVKCVQFSKWKSLVTSASMKKRISGMISSDKRDLNYDLRSYNLNFDKREDC